jgi:PilZ domain
VKIACYRAFECSAVSDKPSKLVLPDRFDKRVHIALPIRVTYWDSENRPRLEMACTYDISPRGARIVGLRGVKNPGDIVALERGRSKSFCRVIWIGEENSELRGQVGLQAVEVDKTMWEAELREMEEIYDPILKDNLPLRPMPAVPGTPTRRRTPRYAVEGLAELMRTSDRASGLQAPLKDIGELGCLVTTHSMLVPGTSLKVILNFANFDLALKGQVRHGALDVGVGIEFREIRKGDRSVLQYVLRKLAEQEREQHSEARAATVSL